MDPYLSKIEKALPHFTNPHGFLGLQDNRFIYQFSPNTKENFLLIKGQRVAMQLIDARGIFVYESLEKISRDDYQVIHSDGSVGLDPYSFSPSISMVDVHLFDGGEHRELYNLLGSHFCIHDGVEGCKFAVYAPSAREVYLRCDKGAWREKVYPMRKVSDMGIYELFIPGCKDSMMYKFSMISKDHKEVLRSDPFGKKYELRPKSASMTYKEQPFQWADKGWLQQRKEQTLSQPVNIYEMHLGAWNKSGIFPNYREIAAELVGYIKEMGYTHVEFLPITEYPLDESWGYQVTGYFAPTSRYGTAADFKYLVNHLHVNNIGVVFDFVPAHFPKDDCFLSAFDGSALFENDHPLMGTHPEWTTHIFDYSSKQVVNFLIASALFWIEQMHVDMIRVDAVQSILYLDHQRGEDYEPNHLGGVENLEGIAFLRKLNGTIKKYHPDVLVAAEDPSLYDGVTRDVENGGLGFSMKWNIGWKHDLFQYLSLSDKEKRENHKVLLNSYKEIFREKYLLTLSHDDVSGGEKSLVNRFSDCSEDKFAYLRLVYSVAIAHPGKKLFFMGAEVGQKEPFNEKDSFRKKALCDHAQIKHKCFTAAINHFYLKEKVLSEIDFDEKGFAWIDSSDYNNSVISFLRKGVTGKLLVIHNFSLLSLENYFVPIPFVTSITEVMNTDKRKYGGRGGLNPHIKIHKEGRGAYLNVPRLSTVICKVVLDDKRQFL
ncbi:MAG: 1,4-alpha-glucan branching enzyme GlgB [Chlamydiia bacterium]|nr:1,4-alpha-glucan branching enzyme GlgB [Chlamydiia bacterium]MCH9617936.1 1,4-alpha-glucan branching enzyme GlgB [Chlamydiia bacterium]MCH9624585.1 1,4-alpha-glucan branching enzyme GlgB [Chlamydiia bacterium]